MIHMAWDGGAVTGLFGQILGQKTVKTACDKTVKFGQQTEDLGRATCVDCIQVFATSERFAERIKAGEFR
jgi:hypothetical protein